MESSDNAPAVFSIDANFVIQCKPAQDLDWGALTPASEVVLLVTRTVQNELDRLKQDGNSRRSKKARAFSTLMRSMVADAAFQLEVKSKNPRIIYRLAPKLEPDRSPLFGADLAQPDDRLIDETFTAASVYPTVRVLTHDTGPQLTARHLGVAYTPIPDEWLLEPEPNTATKVVIDLQRRVSALESARPEIELRLEGWSIENGPLTFEWARYGEFPDEMTQLYIDWMLQSNPFTSLASPRVGFGVYASVGNEERLNKDYANDYESWKDSLPASFTRIGKHITQYARAATSTLNISNTGSVPAENLEIEWNLDVGRFLAPKVVKVVAGKAPIPEVKLPNAPEPPQRRGLLEHIGYASQLSGMRTLPQILKDQRRERDKFYWKPERPKAEKSSWVLECEEFRHKKKPKKFDFRVCSDADIRNGTITITAHASNMAEPAILRVPFSLKVVDGDIKKAFSEWTERYDT